MKRRTINGSRRGFLVASGATLVGCATATTTAKSPPGLGRLGYKSPNEKLNVGAIGAGGKGASDIESCARENIIALCDIDDERAAKMFTRFPQARRYKDFRRMLDTEKLDAVTISTADHGHAIAALWAMERGIHVYVQKPLTHNITEARLLLAAARKYKVATQMGNQGHSGEGVRQLCELLWSGAIGDVREVHAWTNRPIWPQGIAGALPPEPVPAHLDWDLFLGPAQPRLYNPGYTPFKWRGFWDYGGGALGDMACHILDPANWALGLSRPTSVECVQQEGRTAESYPKKSMVKFEFAARGSMPPVTLIWYDGGLLPPRPQGVPDDQKLGDGDNGSYFVGDRGIITTGTYGDRTRLLPDERMIDFKPVDQILTRSPGHTRDWIRACKGGDPACSNFEYAAPFTECVLLGTIAQRLDGKLLWDADQMRFTNRPEANQYLTRQYRKGWELPEGLKAASALAAIVVSACLTSAVTTPAERQGTPRARLAALGDREGVEARNATARVDRNAVLLTFTGDRGTVGTTTEHLGLPRDWRGFGRLVIAVENGAVPTTVDLSVLGAHGRVMATRDLGATNAAVLEVPLGDLPLAAGGTTPFVPEAVQIGSSSARRQERALTVRSLELLASTETAAPLVDAFGQRARGEWPGKVRRLEDLRAAADSEAREKITPRAARDIYGGWTGGPRWQEGGFFTIEEDGDRRSWLVDPLGNAFWSVGITGARTLADATPVHGRESWFERLPDPRSPEGRDLYLPTDGQPGLAFYRWNILRKWGSVAAWRDRTLDRFARWGFNTVGAFTVDPEMVIQRRVPHSRMFNTLVGSGVPQTPRGFPDVFDPQWPAYVDRLGASEAAPNKDNPWLVGYFVDDEPNWSGMRLLDITRGSHLRGRWSKFLHEMYPELPALNAAWATRFRSWDQVRELVPETLPSGRAQEDLATFEGIYADTYFSTIAATLKKHDPNHLYLGCRFARVPPANEAIIRAAGRHIDVLTVNSYTPEPERALFDRWHVLGGKPILIGGHRVALLGPQQVAPRDRGLPAPERQASYVRFVGASAGMPYVVGAHWSQYVDQPLTGRFPDGENQLIGFVDITDRPHEDLVTAAREVTARVYPLHAAAR